MTAEIELSGWGRWPRRTCDVATPAGPDKVVAALGTGSAIARGLGRAYGDSAMNPERTVSTARLDRFISFDAATGELVAEAGVSLGQIIETFLPLGFFPPVTPGTKFVTLGGAIAADVHGKNHHGAGAFGDHVLWLDLTGPDGGNLRCSTEENTDLFRATIGAMGLTGVITRAAIRLIPVETGWIRQRTVVAENLEAAIETFEANLDVTYSVAWIDCLASGDAQGRSLVYLGEHARADDPDLPTGDLLNPPARRKKKVPIDAPSWALNRLSVRAFNHLYFRAGQRAPESQLIDWDTYFYPLDAVLEWNRIYGARGFAQYQCALPLEASRAGLSALLDTIAAAGLGSFLAVLKRFGKGAANRPLSFPIEGYTLALDFPMSLAALTLMDRLDEITLGHGGRLYLAKDSRMTQHTFEESYATRRQAFTRIRNKLPGAERFQSLQSKRLGL